jgi:RHS repeat-associated protein
VYDDEGNRVSRTRISNDPADDYTSVYDWDYRNRLTAVSFYDNSAVETLRIEYDYDARDLRVSRKLFENGGSTPTVEEHFVYDETGELVLVFDGDADLRHRYVNGPGVDEVLVDEVFTDAGTFDELLWPLSDHQGTIRDVVSEHPTTGNTVLRKHTEYETYGLVTGEAFFEKDADPIANPSTHAEAIDQLHTYTGRELDRETGLYYYRARWYDPHAGRFLSEDPAEDDPNLYRYVGNSPLNYTDPSGLQRMPLDNFSLAPLPGPSIDPIQIDYGSLYGGDYGQQADFIFGGSDVSGLSGSFFQPQLTFGGGVSSTYDLGSLLAGSYGISSGYTYRTLAGADPLANLANIEVLSLNEYYGGDTILPNYPENWRTFASGASHGTAWSNELSAVDGVSADTILNQARRRRSVEGAPYASDLIALGRQLGENEQVVDGAFTGGLRGELISHGQMLAQRSLFERPLGGGYFDEFGWHRSFCMSCHDASNPNSVLKMAVARESMNTWPVFVGTEFAYTAAGIAGGELLSQSARTGTRVVRNLSRGAQLRSQYGDTFLEYARFRKQGFSAAQAKYLTEPYPGVGHHFPIPQATARKLGVPNWVRDSRFNVLWPSGISRG